ncbi:hypothetical protein Scani_37820 [Streptomyces caniferus]|uniref:Uncharacterized protein n=1 Tax=Streptomyces caniferus TaxID=285557 RepID=A0A640S9L3_9ACTN|nr:hypothetical protein Scani_37820 [Streptomyces caniferus]
MGGDPAAPDEAGGCQQEHPTAHRGDAAGGCPGRGDPLGQRAVLRRLVDAVAAHRHQGVDPARVEIGHTVSGLYGKATGRPDQAGGGREDLTVVTA